MVDTDSYILVAACFADSLTVHNPLAADMIGFADNLKEYTPLAADMVGFADNLVGVGSIVADMVGFADNLVGVGPIVVDMVGCADNLVGVGPIVVDMVGCADKKAGEVAGSFELVYTQGGHASLAADWIDVDWKIVVDVQEIGMVGLNIVAAGFVAAVVENSLLVAVDMLEADMRADIVLVVVDMQEVGLLYDLAFVIVEK